MNNVVEKIMLVYGFVENQDLLQDILELLMLVGSYIQNYQHEIEPLNFMRNGQATCGSHFCRKKKAQNDLSR